MSSLFFKERRGHRLPLRERGSAWREVRPSKVKLWLFPSVHITPCLPVTPEPLECFSCGQFHNLSIVRDTPPIEEGRSPMRKLLVAVAILSMLLGCAISPEFYGWPTEGGPGSPPVIEAYYAPKSVAPSSAWNLYLQAQDPEGDLLYIACIPDQTGYGPLDTIKISLKGNDRAEFYGYVAMPIPAFDPIQAADISFTMAVLIRDQQGNTSQLIKLFFTLDGTPGQAVPSQWQGAANHHLGDILVNPSHFTSSGVQGSHKGND